MVITKDYNFNNTDFKLPEDLGKRTALALLDELFNGGAVDSTNQSYALMLMSLTQNSNISSIKIGRVTQQSVVMLRNIKKFFNVQFKITECEDDVYSDSESDEEGEQDQAEDSSDKEVKSKSKSEQVEFPKAFIFSCIGIGLTNIARKTE